MQRLFTSLAASVAIVSISAASASAVPASTAPIQLAQASGTTSGPGSTGGSTATPDAGTNNSGNRTRNVPGTGETTPGATDTRNMPETAPAKDWPKTGGSVESERPGTTIR